MDQLIDLEAADEEAATVAKEPVRHGFLPIVTNWFDRLFMGIYLFVALELFWLRFVEWMLPLTFCHILAVALGVLIVWKG